MAEKEKEALGEITQKVQELDPENRKYILGLMDGMAMERDRAKAARAEEKEVPNE